jgi:hypothetical protein
MYVKDDHSYTRGAGAIAAMDAVSPARRRAMARAERALAVRELLTAGAISETGQEAAFSRPAPKPPIRPFPGRPRPGKPLPPGRPFRPAKGVDSRFELKQIKSPGSVIGPSKATEPKATISTISPTTTSTALPTPPKSPVTIVAGGSGASWTSPARAAAMPSDNPPPPWAPEPEDEAPATAAAPPKTSGKLLMYAAIGIGAWWLLTRKK